MLGRNTSIKAVLFDLDGTLVDTSINICFAINSIRRFRGYPEVDLACVRAAVSLGAQELLLSCLGDAVRNLDEDLRLFRSVLAEVPTNAVAIYDAAISTIDAISMAASVAIVTNKPEALARRLLSDLNIAARFNIIVGGDTTADRKPSPVPIIHALNFLECKASDALMVGDSDVDARAAEAAGCRFALFMGGYGPLNYADKVADCKFASFRTLVEFVEGTLSRSSLPLQV